MNLKTNEHVAVVSDAFQELGYKTRIYGSSIRIYKGRNRCATLLFSEDGNIRIEIENECGSETRADFEKLGLGKYVGKVVKTISWQGTQFIEPKINDVHNRLAHLIVAKKQRTDESVQGHWDVNLKEAADDINKAVELRDWLDAQKPPASVRRWTESKIRHIDHLIKEATDAFAWFKMYGTK
jgi:hypothetical protein